MFRDFGLSPTPRLMNPGLDLLAVDVYEDANNLIAEMNLPGLHGEDIDVEVEHNHLRVSGKREEVQEKKEKNHYAKEIPRSSFQRVIALSDSVEPERITAGYSNACLRSRCRKRHRRPIKLKCREVNRHIHCGRHRKTRTCGFFGA